MRSGKETKTLWAFIFVMKCWEGAGLVFYRWVARKRGSLWHHWNWQITCGYAVSRSGQDVVKESSGTNFSPQKQQYYL